MRFKKGIKKGDKVCFSVENQWSGGYYGPTTGILHREKGEWFIITKAGIMTIGKGYDAYYGSIEKIN